MVASSEWTHAQAARSVAKWRSLLPFGPPRSYAGNAVVFSQGEKPNSVFLIGSGIVKLVPASPEGDRALVGLRYPGQLVGSRWRSFEMGYLVTALAAVRCEIYRCDASALESAERSDRAVTDLHRAAIESDLWNLTAAHLDRKALPPAERLERALWELAVVLGAGESSSTARLALPLNNSEMANLCGISESRYKQVRRELEKAGRIRRQDRRIWTLHRRDSRATAASD